jgi:hypothetical protein
MPRRYDEAQRRRGSGPADVVSFVSDRVEAHQLPAAASLGMLLGHLRPTRSLVQRAADNVEAGILHLPRYVLPQQRPDGGWEHVMGRGIKTPITQHKYLHVDMRQCGLFLQQTVAAYNGGHIPPAQATWPCWLATALGLGRRVEDYLTVAQRRGSSYALPRRGGK